MNFSTGEIDWGANLDVVSIHWSDSDVVSATVDAARAVRAWNVRLILPNDLNWLLCALRVFFFRVPQGGSP